MWFSSGATWMRSYLSGWNTPSMTGIIKLLPLAAWDTHGSWLRRQKQANGLTPPIVVVASPLAVATLKRACDSRRPHELLLARGARRFGHLFNATIELFELDGLNHCLHIAAGWVSINLWNVPCSGLLAINIINEDLSAGCHGHGDEPQAELRATALG